MSRLRNAGEHKVASLLRDATKRYMENNDRQFPAKLNQLQRHLDQPLDDAVFQRWQIVSETASAALGYQGGPTITQKSAVDDVFDFRIFIGADGGLGQTDFLSRDIAETMQPVWAAFRSANNRQFPDDKSELLPYAATPEQQAALEKLMLRDSVSK
jgi:hypothetical protein